MSSSPGLALASHGCINFGFVGLGGYAGDALKAVLGSAGGAESRRFRVTAVHDNFPENFSEKIARLKDRGIHFYKTYDELLASDIGALWLPLPIDLHFRLRRRPCRRASTCSARSLRPGASRMWTR